MVTIDDIRVAFASAEREAVSLRPRDYKRKISWNERLVGLLGGKGVGKTTVLLQRRANLLDKGLYLSLDHPLATAIELTELARLFSLEGGTDLFFDEVHKYPDWSSKIKSIYDTTPNINVVFSGSSALKINAEKGDLSRRAAVYQLPVISLREYIELESGLNLPSFSLDDILNRHYEISRSSFKQLRPVTFFKSYLEHGAYPFYREGLARYFDKLRNAVLYTIESDLVQIYSLEPSSIPKLRKFLQLLATEVPLSPNISAIAQALELSRQTVSRYLDLLQSASIIALLEQSGRGYQKLSKPEKIFFDNTNVLYAFSNNLQNIGTLRETFVLSQLRSAGHQVEAPKSGDFLVNADTIFEIGGRNKTRKQIKTIANSSVFRDDIEEGTKNIIPLWLLGFLY